jgi:hypothetical protein
MNDLYLEDIENIELETNEEKYRELVQSLSEIDDLNFVELSSNRKEALVRTIKLATYKPGDVICREGSL